MAQSNHERVGKALELLRQGLYPYVEREMKACYGDDWPLDAREALREDWNNGVNWDSQALLKLMWFRWNEVFARQLGPAERGLVGELRGIRNNWAHQKAFTADDTYRALDTTDRLLTAIAAPEAAEVDRQKQEVLRLRYEEQRRRKPPEDPIGGKPTSGLRTWREVITPHPDVASGRYQQAEFAADLNQVYQGEGADEYRDPRRFYARTFLTYGLRELLTSALKRLSSRGGDPVVQLQTNFGGGKTHSMLALYHLFSGVGTGDLPGIDGVLKDAGVERIPSVRRAVLVGYALSPGQSTAKSDGTVINTLWGELGWQLLGKEGYALVAEADRLRVSPGSGVLVELFRRAAPCLILIDEWVAYLRSLYGVADMPAGSFDTNLTFAQALTEAAKAADRTLVVATLPASQIEVGGEGGQEALSRLQRTFSRVESTWRPASAEESFEIVRRRLFEEITDPQLHIARDTVARAFADFYRTQGREFPTGCGEADYERRVQAAYPIHPELFDRLYDDWSSLERFQRTRGVLRLMSSVIHTLWEQQDASLLIMPANVPVSDPAVQSELTRYLEENWAPIIERDVDGPNSLPLRLDRENPNLGRYSAARRVARTIFLGSAPTQHAAHKGIDDGRIRLGCVQPGEATATFGDALRRLTENGSYLFSEGGRYWFGTQPSVARLAQDRAAQQDEERVQEEIETRLRGEQNRRGELSRVHACPASGDDVPDERDARLVILRPREEHAARDQQSRAMQAAKEMLESRGTAPRIYRNTLVFLAPDRARLEDLKQAVRQYLAWKSIHEDRETLNLDAQQRRQAQERLTQAEDTVKQRVPEAYAWLLVPGQSDPKAPVEWQEVRLQGQGSLAERASRRLITEELLITQFGGVRLRMELDRVPLWRGDHVGVKQLADDFAQYLYLPRLKNTEVLLQAISSGVGSLNWRQDTFGYAQARAEGAGRYKGLVAGQLVTPLLDSQSVVVKPDVAARQLELDEREHEPDGDQRGDRDEGDGTDKRDTGKGGGTTTPTKPTERKLRRYYGTVPLNSLRLERDASEVFREVVQHLEGQLGSRVRITLEIEADIPDGVPGDVVRTVTENARTLRFTQSAFEES